MTYFNNFHKNNEHPFFRVHKVPSAVRGNKTPPDSHRLHYPRPSDFKGSGVTHTHTHMLSKCPRVHHRSLLAVFLQAPQSSVWPWNLPYRGRLSGRVDASRSNDQNSPQQPNPSGPPVCTHLSVREYRCACASSFIWIAQGHLKWPVNGRRKWRS